MIYGAPSDAPTSVLQNLSLVSPVFPLFIGILALVRLAFAGTSFGTLAGFSRSTIGSDFAWGLSLGAVAIFVTVWSMRAVATYAPLPPFNQFPIYFHLYFATVGAIIPGVFEEIYFRGLLIRIGEGMPKIVLLLLSATAFSIWHIGTPAYLPHTFILGLMWGIMALLTGRLAPSIIAHVTANSGFGMVLLSGYEVFPA